MLGISIQLKKSPPKKSPAGASAREIKNMYISNNEQIIFSVTAEELQKEAMRRTGRGLTDEELCTASKGIESGLSFGIETVFNAAIDEAINIWKEETKTRD